MSSTIGVRHQQTQWFPPPLGRLGAAQVVAVEATAGVIGQGTEDRLAAEVTKMASRVENARREFGVAFVGEVVEEEDEDEDEDDEEEDEEGSDCEGGESVECARRTLRLAPSESAVKGRDACWSSRDRNTQRMSRETAPSGIEDGGVKRLSGAVLSGEVDGREELDREDSTPNPPIRRPRRPCTMVLDPVRPDLIRSLSSVGVGRLGMDVKASCGRSTPPPLADLDEKPRPLPPLHSQQRTRPVAIVDPSCEGPRRRLSAPAVGGSPPPPPGGAAPLLAGAPLRHRRCSCHGAGAVGARSPRPAIDPPNLPPRRHGGAWASRDVTTTSSGTDVEVLVVVEEEVVRGGVGSSKECEDGVGGGLNLGNGIAALDGGRSNVVKEGSSRRRKRRQEEAEDEEEEDLDGDRSHRHLGGGVLGRRGEIRSGEGGNHRKRSCSTSTTASSSAVSTSSASASSISRRRHKHRKRRRRRLRAESDDEVVEGVSEEGVANPTPRVNPIFVWAKQDDAATILEVLCEDYDKRNRIRLTKTPNGWRAIPRTERFSATIATTPSSNQPTDHVGPTPSKDTVNDIPSVEGPPDPSVLLRLPLATTVKTPTRRRSRGSHHEEKSKIKADMIFTAGVKPQEEAKPQEDHLDSPGQRETYGGEGPGRPACNSPTEKESTETSSTKGPTENKTVRKPRPIKPRDQRLPAKKGRRAPVKRSKPQRIRKPTPKKIAATPTEVEEVSLAEMAKENEVSAQEEDESEQLPQPHYHTRETTKGGLKNRRKVVRVTRSTLRSRAAQSNRRVQRNVKSSRWSPSKPTTPIADVEEPLVKENDVIASEKKSAEVKEPENEEEIVDDLAGVEEKVELSVEEVKEEGEKEMEEDEEKVEQAEEEVTGEDEKEEVEEKQEVVIKEDVCGEDEEVSEGKNVPEVDYELEGEVAEEELGNEEGEVIPETCVKDEEEEEVVAKEVGDTVEEEEETVEGSCIENISVENNSAKEASNEVEDVELEQQQESMEEDVEDADPVNEGDDTAEAEVVSAIAEEEEDIGDIIEGNITEGEVATGEIAEEGLPDDEALVNTREEGDEEQERLLEMEEEHPVTEDTENSLVVEGLAEEENAVVEEEATPPGGEIQTQEEVQKEDSPTSTFTQETEASVSAEGENVEEEVAVPEEEGAMAVEEEEEEEVEGEEEEEEDEEEDDDEEEEEEDEEEEEGPPKTPPPAHAASIPNLIHSQPSAAVDERIEEPADLSTQKRKPEEIDETPPFKRMRRGHVTALPPSTRITTCPRSMLPTKELRVPKVDGSGPLPAHSIEPVIFQNPQPGVEERPVEAKTPQKDPLDLVHPGSESIKDSLGKGEMGEQWRSVSSSAPSSLKGPESKVEVGNEWEGNLSIEPPVKKIKVEVEEEEEIASESMEPNIPAEDSHQITLKKLLSSKAESPNVGLATSVDIVVPKPKVEISFPTDVNEGIGKSFSRSRLLELLTSPDAHKGSPPPPRTTPVLRTPSPANPNVSVVPIHQPQPAVKIEPRCEETDSSCEDGKSGSELKRLKDLLGRRSAAKLALKPLSVESPTSLAIKQFANCPETTLTRLPTPETQQPVSLSVQRSPSVTSSRVEPVRVPQPVVRNHKPSKTSSPATLPHGQQSARRTSAREVNSSPRIDSTVGAEQDAATAAAAAAIHNMLWLPYLGQLEMAVNTGNRELLASLGNAMFGPPPPVSPSSQSSASPRALSHFPTPPPPQNPPFVHGSPFLHPSTLPPSAIADYKSRVELSQTLNLWQDIMAANASSTFNSTHQEMMAQESLERNGGANGLIGGCHRQEANVGAHLHDRQSPRFLHGGRKPSPVSTPLSPAHSPSSDFMRYINAGVLPGAALPNQRAQQVTHSNNNNYGIRYNGVHNGSNAIHNSSKHGFHEQKQPNARHPTPSQIYRNIEVSSCQLQQTLCQAVSSRSRKSPSSSTGLDQTKNSVRRQPASSPSRDFVKIPTSHMATSSSRQKPTVTCRSLLNLLSNPRPDGADPVLPENAMEEPSQGIRSDQQRHGHLLAALARPSVNQHEKKPMDSSRLPPAPCGLRPHVVGLDPESECLQSNRYPAPLSSVPQSLLPIGVVVQPMDLSGRSGSKSAGKKEERELEGFRGQEVATLSTANGGTHPHLWHPLFGSQKTCDPWRWRTVAVNGD